MDVSLKKNEFQKLNYIFNTHKESEIYRFFQWIFFFVKLKTALVSQIASNLSIV